MSKADASISDPAHTDTAKRQQERDHFALPAARLPFRIAGGVVAALFAWMLWSKARSVISGDVALTDLIEAEYGVLAIAFISGLAFGIVAVTGKVPRPVWRLFERTGSID